MWRAVRELPRHQPQRQCRNTSWPLDCCCKLISSDLIGHTFINGIINVQEHQLNNFFFFSYLNPCSFLWSNTRLETLHSYFLFLVWWYHCNFVIITLPFFMYSHSIMCLLQVCDILTLFRWMLIRCVYIYIYI